MDNQVNQKEIYLEKIMSSENGWRILSDLWKEWKLIVAHLEIQDKFFIWSSLRAVLIKFQILKEKFEKLKRISKMQLINQAIEAIHPIEMMIQAF
jgi:hypothetical protein